jgi:hypothetical protein
MEQLKRRKEGKEEGRRVEEEEKTFRASTFNVIFRVYCI